MSRILPLFALAALAVPAAAAGGEPASVALQGPAVETPRAIQLNAAPDADLRTGFGGSGVVVSASSDASSVAITLGRDWDSRSFDGIEADPSARVHYAHNSWTLKLSAPLDPSGDEGDFLAAGGLAGSTALEFGYNRVMAPTWTVGQRRKLSEDRDKAIREAVGACATATAKVDAGASDAERQKALDAARDTCRDKEASVLVEEGYMSKATADHLINQEFAGGVTWIFNLSGGIGYQSFDFRDPATFETHSSDRTPYSASVSFGIVPPSTSAFIGAGGEYKQDYVDATARTLCQPPPAAGPQECVTGPFGGPVSQKVVDAFLVARWQGETSVFKKPLPYGFELKAAYGFENKVTGAGAALYLVPDKDKALRGGVRLLWQTDDKDPATKDDNFTIGVFVSSAFSVF